MDTERKQTYDLGIEAYEDCGYEVVKIPRASPRLRAEFILSELLGECPVLKSGRVGERKRFVLRTPTMKLATGAMP